MVKKTEDEKSRGTVPLTSNLLVNPGLEGVGDWGWG
jgi:hypothetical protein